MTHNRIPTILCFSGLDPTGGAGIQADIEAIAACGAHAAPIITANTVQDTHSAHDFQPVDSALIQRQFEAVFNDIQIDAIKIGMLGTAQTAQTVSDILQQHPDIPVIFDPVLASGNGASLSQSQLVDVICTSILPRTHILTPNTLEAIRLGQGDLTAEEAAQELNALGAEYVLLTGSHAQSHDIVHRLYRQQSCIATYQNERLSGEFHGSGCTLSASLAAYIAAGNTPEEATGKALDYTLKTLRMATSPGHGQFIPRRII